jgi:hypothetical protein
MWTHPDLADNRESSAALPVADPRFLRAARRRGTWQGTCQEANRVKDLVGLFTIHCLTRSFPSSSQGAQTACTTSQCPTTRFLRRARTPQVAFVATTRRPRRGRVRGCQAVNREPGVNNRPWRTVDRPCITHPLASAILAWRARATVCTVCSSVLQTVQNQL